MKIITSIIIIVNKKHEILKSFFIFQEINVNNTWVIDENKNWVIAIKSSIKVKYIFVMVDKFKWV